VWRVNNLPNVVTQPLNEWPLYRKSDVHPLEPPNHHFQTVASPNSHTMAGRRKSSEINERERRPVSRRQSDRQCRTPEVDETFMNVNECAASPRGLRPSVLRWLRRGLHISEISIRCQRITLVFSGTSSSISDSPIPSLLPPLIHNSAHP